MAFISLQKKNKVHKVTSIGGQDPDSCFSLISSPTTPLHSLFSNNPDLLGVLPTCQPAQPQSLCNCCSFYLQCFFPKVIPWLTSVFHAHSNKIVSLTIFLFLWPCFIFLYSTYQYQTCNIIYLLFLLFIVFLPPLKYKLHRVGIFLHSYTFSIQKNVRQVACSARTYAHACAFVHTLMYMHTQTYTHIHVCTYTYTCIRTHVHTYPHINLDYSSIAGK